MKFALVYLLFLALAAPVLCDVDTHPSVYRNDVVRSSGANNAGSWANSIKLPFKLPDWITRWFPDLENILLLSKNVIAGTPARVVSTSINALCNIVTYTGFLKPSYVPPSDRLSFALHMQNTVYEYPLTNVPALLANDHFHAEKNLTIFISDWESFGNDPDNVVNIIANAYVTRGSENFVSINVGDFVDSIYKWAVLDSKQTGQLIGDALVQITRLLSPNKMHFIGHGLGAHIAGVAGRYIQQVTGEQVERITALDPSRICHDEQYGSHTLQLGDAAFVDVIHSNSGVLGKSEPIGDADFYPNGPISLPPGCNDIICAHNLAVRYYAESVQLGSEYSFMAVRCTSLKDMKNNKCHTPKIPMGLYTDSRARGSYYLQTNSRSPYGKDAPSKRSVSI